MKNTLTLSPLDGVRVLERSVTLSASFAGTLLARLGAEVSVDRRFRDGVHLSSVQACFADAGKPVFTGEDGAAFDIIIDDRLCAGELAARFTAVPDHVLMAVLQNAPAGEGRSLANMSAHGAMANSGLSIALGRPEHAPLGLPPGVAESTLGLQAAAAILAEWTIARKDGIQRTLRLSLADALAFYVAINSKMFEGYPRRWHREGRRAAGSSGPYPAAIFDSAEGPVGLIGRSRSDLAGLIAAMGNPAWAERDGYDDPWNVAQHHADEVDSYVQDWVSRKSEHELTRLSLEHGFVVAPVRQLGDVLRHEQHRLRNFWQDAPDGLTQPGLPWRVLERPSAPVDYGKPRIGTRGRPLEGIRVLDLSWVWAGPMVTMIMADLGAEVIKVEHPSRPDGSRMRGRPSRLGVPVEGPELEVTPYFHQVNHGKMSLGVNLASDEGGAVLRDLAASCDVVVENMRPGVLRRRGMDFGALSKSNPGLIMLSMSLAGQTGPLSGLKGYAPVMGGLSGLEGLIGYAPDDVTGMYTHSFADATAGVFGLAAVMAGLLDRERTGSGAWIDLSQVEAVISTLTLPILEAQSLTSRTGLSGNDDERYWFQDTLRADGVDNWIAVTVRSYDDAERLAATLSVSPGPRRPRGDLAGPVLTALRKFVGMAPAADAISLLRSAGVSAELVHSLDSRREARLDGLLAEGIRIDHPYWNDEFIAVAPWAIDGEISAAQGRAPLLGEHTAQILRQKLGYTPTRIDSLRDSGAIYMAHAAAVEPEGAR